MEGKKILESNPIPDCADTVSLKEKHSGTSHLMSFEKIRCKSRALRKLPGMRAKPAALSLSSKLCVMHATHVCTLTPNV